MATQIVIIVTTIMMKLIIKYNSVKDVVKVAPNDTQHQNNAHPKSSPIDCDGVQPTNAQCQMVPISISWYRDCWTRQFKSTCETKQEIITVSYPTHQHSHTNFWYVCLLERAFFSYLDFSYHVWYVYIKRSIRARTKVFRRKHIIQPTSFDAYSSTCL